MKSGSKGIIFEKESYQLIGIVYQVFNNLGYGHREVVYQKAIAEEFKAKGIPFEEQLRAKIRYKGKEIGVYILDFLVFDKIVIELKQGNHFSRADINQLYSYLKATKKKLGILVRFTGRGVRIKRVINLK